MSAVPSLETFFTDRRFFAVDTATPVQRAVCRVCQGEPFGDLAVDPDVVEAFGGADAVASLSAGSFRPREVDLLAGIRSGKSRFVAAHALWSSQVVDLSKLKPGEVPRYAIVSVNLTSARATFNHLAGTMLDRPLLRALLIGEPESDTLHVKHPSGRPIEITVAAGARAGANLVSVWLIGVAFEETPRQQSEASGLVVNVEEQMRAAAGRVLDGGQILSAGAPWAPMGFSYERFSSHFGRPSPDRVIVRATGPQMNPLHWTPARCAALERSNPDAFVTDVLAGFRDPSSGLLSQSEVRSATRKEGPTELAPRSGRSYLAVCDPGTRGNAWALMLLAAYRDKEDAVRYEIVLAREWRGSSLAPLSPARVLAETKRLLEPYGVRQVCSDQHSADALVDLGVQASLRVIPRTVVAGNAPELVPGMKSPAPSARVYRNDMFETMKAIFATGAISIPDDRVIANDLLSIRRRLTSASVTYDLPSTADGRHCDYAACLALGLSLFPSSADSRAAAARNARIRSLALVGAAYGYGDVPPEVGAVPIEVRHEVLMALASGRSSNDVGESVWAKIARVNGWQGDSEEAA